MAEGRFAWYELITSHAEAAKAFYGNVLGWTALDASAPGVDYALFAAGPALVAGVMELPEEVKRGGRVPNWLGYVEVDDVDAAAARVVSLGGTLQVPPTAVAGISRFAIFADPQGATIGLLRWANPEGVPEAETGAPGRVGWHELLAADWEQAMAFYGSAFGWQRADADVGEMGTYQLFAAGGETIGGIVTKPPLMPAPSWLYYFNVDDLDAAAERVKAGGGRILDGPFDIPGGSWIVQCLDPQGAMFALEGLRHRKTVGYFARAAPGASDPRSRRWSW